MLFFENSFKRNKKNINTSTIYQADIHNSNVLKLCFVFRTTDGFKDPKCLIMIFHKYYHLFRVFILFKEVIILQLAGKLLID